ncbi:MAG: hypothetical protein D6718_13605 [Acidobacteria bacterium]|nr:MAG: hypothetical protein D6718_13605 [Acidobacteriota bacterium]
MRETTDSALEAGRALHNMSAPPRLSITVSPLRKGAARAEQGTGAGCKLIGFLDLSLLCGKDWNSLSPRERLLAALKLARSWSGGSVTGTTRLTVEAATDELLDRLAAQDPARLGLPRVALARRFPRWPHKRVRRVRSSAAALVLLSRLSGPLFLAIRSPSVEPIVNHGGVVAFYRVGAEQEKR